MRTSFLSFSSARVRTARCTKFARRWNQCSGRTESRCFSESSSAQSGNGEPGTAKAPASGWWASYFDEQYMLEYEPIFSLAQDRRDTARLIELLGLPSEARLLDVPCGQGRHAHLLAEAGYDVDGFDLSKDLLDIARKRGTGPMLRYHHGDMRRLPARWTGRFDAVLNLFTSFGFFLLPRDDDRVVAEWARVLKPRGTLIWHGGNRDGVMRRFLARDWWLADGDTMI